MKKSDASTVPKKKKKYTLADLHRILKEDPVNFRELPDMTQPRGMGVPRAFMKEFRKLRKERKDLKCGADMLAVMTTLLSMPPAWQWQASDLQEEIGNTERAVDRAVVVLKSMGWLAHVNVYVEGEILMTYIMAFDKRRKVYGVDKRYSLSRRNNRWTLKSPEGTRTKLTLPAWTKMEVKADPIDAIQEWENEDDKSEITPGDENHLSAHHVRLHNTLIESSSLTLQGRDLAADILPAAPEGFEASQTPEVSRNSKVEKKTLKEQVEDPFSRPIQMVSEDKMALDKLEKLGKKAADPNASFEDKLNYETFIEEQIIPRLTAPPENVRAPRHKVWRMRWAQASMWGLLFQKMSMPGEFWNNNQARRLIRRISEGYVTPEAMRKVLYGFTWNRTGKTLEAWTYRGKEVNDDGTFEIIDFWHKTVANSYLTMRQEASWHLSSFRDALFPQGDEAELPGEFLRHVNEATANWAAASLPVWNRMLELCEMLGTRSPETLAYLLRGSERALPQEIRNTLLDDGKDRLIHWLAMDSSGIKLVQEKGSDFHPELGADFLDRVREVHRDYVPKLVQRLKYYGMSTDGVEVML